MARSNTALLLKGNIVNNKFNKLHEFTKQGHERKRSANKTKSADTNMSHSFAKFVSFGERWRSLIPTIGFVKFVKFVVKTKNKVDNKRAFEAREPSDENSKFTG